MKRPAGQPVEETSGALRLDRAVRCIESGIAKARELGFQVAIAVVDAGGHLVATHRMDGALWVTPDIARAKANATVAFRASTEELEERFTRRLLFAENVAAMGQHQFVFGKGGIPILEGGEIVGGVGVSGAVPAENDHLIADAAAGHPVLPRRQH